MVEWPEIEQWRSQETTRGSAANGVSGAIAREEYKHFSQGTHPNRSHIPYVFLGEGNRFTLGAIPPIDPLNLGGHVRHLMSLCYWYVGVFLYFFREVVTPRVDEQFKSSFLDLTPRIKRLKVTLDEQLNELRERSSKEPVPQSVGTKFLKTKPDQSSGTA
jgi:hypothetical protein